MQKFQGDLKFGQKYEKLFCDYMNFKRCKVSTGKFKPYDIIDEESNLKYEVKSDRLAYKTGNIAIEYECYKNPSGISSTEADYYAYYIINPNGHSLYVVPVPYIKEHIKTANCRKVSGGDKGYSKMYLIKIKEFERFKKM